MIYRHSTYAIVTSKSYNPFINLEHSVNREQGFLVYLPVINEFKLHMQMRNVSYSFYRPNNLVSGIALKSRTRTITSGRVLRSDERYLEVIVSEGDPEFKVSFVYPDGNLFC